MSQTKTTRILAIVDDWWPLWGALALSGLSVLLWPMASGFTMLGAGVTLYVAAILIGHIRETISGN